MTRLNWHLAWDNLVSVLIASVAPAHKILFSIDTLTSKAWVTVDMIEQLCAPSRSCPPKRRALFPFLPLTHPWFPRLAWRAPDVIQDSLAPPRSPGGGAGDASD